jgi:hypothetical protein
MVGWVALAAAGMSSVPAQMPAAQVEGDRIVHAAEGVTVGVPAAATYVGGERFTLYGVADAEIHVFAEADAQRRLARLYWIQFESYLPSRPELRYDYSDNRRTLLWDTVTWVGAGPRDTSDPGRPGSDRQQVMNILARAGYTVPPEMMNARLVQMLDDPAGTGRGRRELMLIYSEDLAPTGRHYAELVLDGRTTEAWEPLEQPLIARAAAAFTVVRR